MPRRAVILIDIQNDYFPGGKWTLSGIDPAADNAARVLAAARSRLTWNLGANACPRRARFWAKSTPGVTVPVAKDPFALPLFLWVLAYCSQT